MPAILILTTSTKEGSYVFAQVYTVSLFTCEHNTSKSYVHISMKFSEEVGNDSHHKQKELKPK